MYRRHIFWSDAVAQSLASGLEAEALCGKWRIIRRENLNRVGRYCQRCLIKWQTKYPEHDLPAHHRPAVTYTVKINFPQTWGSER